MEGEGGKGGEVACQLCMSRLFCIARKTKKEGRKESKVILCFSGEKPTFGRICFDNEKKSQQ